MDYRTHLPEVCKVDMRHRRPDRLKIKVCCKQCNWCDWFEQVPTCPKGTHTLDVVDYEKR